VSDTDTATIPRLTYDQVVASLKRAVQIMGEDYVYASPEGVVLGCRYYTQAGSPSCIVGYVLEDAGMKPFGLDDVSNKSSVSDLVTGWCARDQARYFELEDFDRRAGYLYDSRTYNLLAAVQRYQDRKCPWGKAVAWALAGEPNHWFRRLPDGSEVWE